MYSSYVIRRSGSSSLASMLNWQCENKKAESRHNSFAGPGLLPPPRFPFTCPAQLRNGRSSGRMPSLANVAILGNAAKRLFCAIKFSQYGRSTLSRSLMVSPPGPPCSSSNLNQRDACRLPPGRFTRAHRAARVQAVRREAGLAASSQLSALLFWAGVPASSKD